MKKYLGLNIFSVLIFPFIGLIFCGLGPLLIFSILSFFGLGGALDQGALIMYITGPIGFVAGLIIGILSIKNKVWIGIGLGLFLGIALGGFFSIIALWSLTIPSLILLAYLGKILAEKVIKKSPNKKIVKESAFSSTSWFMILVVIVVSILLGLVLLSAITGDWYIFGIKETFKETGLSNLHFNVDELSIGELNFRKSIWNGPDVGYVQDGYDYEANKYKELPGIAGCIVSLKKDTGRYYGSLSKRANSNKLFFHNFEYYDLKKLKPYVGGEFIILKITKSHSIADTECSNNFNNEEFILKRIKITEEEISNKTDVAINVLDKTKNFGSETKPLPEGNKYCDDIDNLNIGSKGYTENGIREGENIVKPINWASDTCINETTINEYYCGNNFELLNKELPCPTGTKCKSGACV